MDTQPKKVFIKRFWWVGIIVIFMISIGIFFISKNNSKPISNSDAFSQLPACPSDLSGLFTARVMDKGVIEALTPLGASNPPGHTFPVDHIYFHGPTDGQPENVYAPGDGIISNISLWTAYDDSNTVIGNDVTLTIGLCHGVEVVMAIPGELSPDLKAVVQKVKNDCKSMPAKHEGESAVKSCSNTIEYPVTAGTLIARTSGNELPEVWALDHNMKTSSEVDWERYESPYYQYAFCFFDLYAGELKNEYYNLFGAKGDGVAIQQLKDQGLDTKQIDPKQLESKFIPRTVEPRCGQVIQNITGTAQGDWFGFPKGSGAEFGESIGGLALIHDNINPLIGTIVAAGNFTEPGVLRFTPTHSGTINREFSEVKPDGNIYCYENIHPADHIVDNKILIQLIDDNHLKIEKQNGGCRNTESFYESYSYDR